MTRQSRKHRDGAHKLAQATVNARWYELPDGYVTSPMWSKSRAIQIDRVMFRARANKHADLTIR